MPNGIFLVTNVCLAEQQLPGIRALRTCCFSTDAAPQMNAIECHLLTVEREVSGVFLRLGMHKERVAGGFDAMHVVCEIPQSQIQI